MAETVIIVRRIAVTEPLARANVMTALAGRGGPVGIVACDADAAGITVSFDDERTSGELVAALATVAATFVPAAAPAFADLVTAVAVASHGLNEPTLDPARLIETYLS